MTDIDLTSEEATQILSQRERKEREQIEEELIDLLNLYNDTYNRQRYYSYYQTSGPASGPDRISFSQFIERLNIQTLRGLLAGVKSRG